MSKSQNILDEKRLFWHWNSRKKIISEYRIEYIVLNYVRIDFFSFFFIRMSSKLDHIIKISSKFYLSTEILYRHDYGHIFGKVQK